MFQWSLSILYALLVLTLRCDGSWQFHTSPSITSCSLSSSKQSLYNIQKSLVSLCSLPHPAPGGVFQPEETKTVQKSWWSCSSVDSNELKCSWLRSIMTRCILTNAMQIIRWFLPPLHLDLFSSVLFGFFFPCCPFVWRVCCYAFVARLYCCAMIIRLWCANALAEIIVRVRAT